MADYTQITDFSAKDALTPGDPEKVLLGSDVDAELEAIATAVASKLNTSGLLAALTAVDGAGSGVDADSVDGVGPVAVGTYTPVASDLSNMDSVTSLSGMYIRVGSIVVVFGTMTLNATAASSGAGFQITLPVASNIGATTDLAGIAQAAASSSGYFQGHVANNKAEFTYEPNVTGGVVNKFVLGYRVI